MSVVARIKGSDETLDDKKKEQQKDEENTEANDVSADESEEVVFVVKGDGAVEKRVVTTGIQDVNYFEIRSGIKEGEKVVSAPYNAISKSLKSGDKVKVVTRQELLGNK